MKAFNKFHLYPLLILSIGTSFASAQQPPPRDRPVSITVNEKPLADVFRDLEKLTNCAIVYPTDKLPPHEKVTLHVTNLPLVAVLKIILANRDFLLDEDGRVICIRAKIPGSVVREDGTPIPHANILLKKRGKGTSTDLAGNFQLGIARKERLQISAIGYVTKDTTLFGIPEYLKIRLRDTTFSILPVDIVSNGYEHILPARSTGSFLKIQPKIIDRQTGRDIISRLDGMVPGVLFNKRNLQPLNPLSSVLIGGLYSINADASPLVVLDAFPFEGNINDINPNDVASVTVLKDAAAASIWGVRAGNGVFVVTTKKGDLSTRPNITFNAQTTVQPPPDLYRLPQLSSAEYVALEQFLFDHEKDIQTSAGPSPVIRILRQQQNGLPEARVQEMLDSLKALDVRDDFRRYIYRPAVDRRYSASISGNSQLIRYYFSGGLDIQDQLLRNDGSRRIYVLSNLSSHPRSKTRIDLTTRYTEEEAQLNNFGDYGAASYRRGEKVMLPYSRLADDTGNPLAIETPYDYLFADYAGNRLLLPWTFRPLEDMGLHQNERKTKNMIFDLSLQQQILNALTATISYRYQKDQTHYEHLYDKAAYFTRSLINYFTSVEDNNTVKYAIPRGGILDKNAEERTTHHLRAGLAFTKRRNEHFISVLIGGEVRESVQEGSSNRLYGIDGSLRPGQVDFAHPQPTIMGGLDLIPDIASLLHKTYRLLSFYNSTSYTYNDTYMLSASLRRDASNIFGVNANEYATPFWSAGIAWNLHKAAFFSNTLLTLLKLRITYGSNGNVHSLPALPRIRYTAGGQDDLGLPYASLLEPSKPNARWEQIRIANFGIDYGIKNNLLTGSFEYYRKVSVDLITLGTADPSTGLRSVLGNNASIKGDGIDFQAKLYKPVGKHFTLTVTGNFSYARYKVNYLHNSLPLETGYVSEGVRPYAIEGYSPFVIVAYKWAGLNANGEPQGLLDGRPSTNYDSILEHTPLSEKATNRQTIPTCFGNLLPEISWKRLTLSANITFRTGYAYLRPTINYAKLVNGQSLHSDYNLRWKAPGDEYHTNVPAFRFPLSPTQDQFYQFADVHLRKADHIRLDDCQLSYALLPEQPMVKRTVRSVSLFAYAKNINLFVYRAQPDDWDPDTPGILPLPLSLSAGVRINI